ncbi:hypothetical protein DSM106972_078070 [Dulcicalothrix desertica PCC 7102]|uniref:Uncharacterized protein n=1 Tax=Dulcicalothrix desertica PCC 7102 TaxID=232991 RepID=A0A3S1C9H8_9CYAN|nr:hypothetical protein [Dulcicalothrix desertica]RUS99365.1 hypothetical protein DSM106972_078070 [Dulcicalothrix desertica PCC 7102]TWH50027.1 hypothetical protein CAL7102_04305 [Dulcicalothrix desertica PCC 7102]
MNTKLVDSLAQAILSLSEDERFLLSEKLDIESKLAPALKQLDKTATFTKLVKQWREENHGVSSTNQMSMHPAYQQIIGMGEAAIPLLLRELEKKSGQWFWALKSITREDPVPLEHRGKTSEMIKAWLEWGRAKGYIC